MHLLYASKITWKMQRIEVLIILTFLLLNLHVKQKNIFENMIEKQEKKRKTGANIFLLPFIFLNESHSLQILPLKFF